MNSSINTQEKHFKVWMGATLGLIKDGKMGASRARAERIKTALSYTAKSSLSHAAAL